MECAQQKSQQIKQSLPKIFEIVLKCANRSEHFQLILFAVNEHDYIFFMTTCNREFLVNSLSFQYFNNYFNTIYILDEHTFSLPHWHCGKPNHGSICEIHDVFQLFCFIITLTRNNLHRNLLGKQIFVYSRLMYRTRTRTRTRTKNWLIHF